MDTIYAQRYIYINLLNVIIVAHHRHIRMKTKGKKVKRGRHSINLLDFRPPCLTDQEHDSRLSRQTKRLDTAANWRRASREDGPIAPDRNGNLIGADEWRPKSARHTGKTTEVHHSGFLMSWLD